MLFFSPWVGVSFTFFLLDVLLPALSFLSYWTKGFGHTLAYCIIIFLMEIYTEFHGIIDPTAGELYFRWLCANPSNSSCKLKEMSKAPYSDEGDDRW
jgi:hypothetical protein